MILRLWIVIRQIDEIGGHGSQIVPTFHNRQLCQAPGSGTLFF